MRTKTRKQNQSHSKWLLNKLFFPFKMKAVVYMLTAGKDIVKPNKLSSVSVAHVVGWENWSLQVFLCIPCVLQHVGTCAWAHTQINLGQIVFSFSKFSPTSPPQPSLSGPGLSYHYEPFHLHTQALEVRVRPHILLELSSNKRFCYRTGNDSFNGWPI